MGADGWPQPMGAPGQASAHIARASTDLYGISWVMLWPVRRDDQASDWAAARVGCRAQAGGCYRRACTGLQARSPRDIPRPAMRRQAVHHGMCVRRGRAIHHAKANWGVVGVFNQCRARPRQMTMGRVVSPLVPSWPPAGASRATRRDAADAVEEP